jgi:predicted DNA binding CopG/RHH family protein
MKGEVNMIEVKAKEEQFTGQSLPALNCLTSAKTSAAQLRAANRYIKGLDEIRVRVAKGEREILKAHAASKGMSLNGYICDLISRDMEDCAANSNKKSD